MRKNVALCACACVLTLLAISNTAAAQCEGLWWEYVGVVLTIHHDTEYNCAVFGFSHEVQLQGDVLVVREHAIARAWADCICPYFTAVQIAGLPPGAYTLRFEYGENEVAQPPAWWTWCELPLVIPGASRDDPDVVMLSSSSSGCGIVTSVPDIPEPGPQIWSTLKAMFR